MRFLRSLRAAVILLVLVGVATAQEVKKKPPALPDYSQAPYVKRYPDSFPYTPYFHKDWEGMSADLYATSPETAPGQSGILVCKDKDGNLKYAEWVYYDMDNIRTLRGYNRTGNKWVFEQEEPPK